MSAKIPTVAVTKALLSVHLVDDIDTPLYAISELASFIVDVASVVNAAVARDADNERAPELANMLDRVENAARQIEALSKALRKDGAS